jgi:hypothetical protein
MINKQSIQLYFLAKTVSESKGMSFCLSGQGRGKMLLSKHSTDVCIQKHMPLLPEVNILVEDSPGMLGAFMNSLVAVRIRGWKDVLYCKTTLHHADCHAMLDGN